MLTEKPGLKRGKVTETQGLRTNVTKLKVETRDTLQFDTSTMTLLWLHGVLDVGGEKAFIKVQISAPPLCTPGQPPGEERDTKTWESCCGLASWWVLYKGWCTATGFTLDVLSDSVLPTYPGFGSPPRLSAAMWTTWASVFWPETLAHDRDGNPAGPTTPSHISICIYIHLT